VTPLAQVSAGQAKGGITGDWQVKADFDGRQITSILSLSNDAEGKLKGEWISFFGLTDLTDIKYEGENLSFVQTSRFGDQERKTKFTGTIQKGKLSGTLSSDRGEYKAEGTRVPRIPGAVGNWETKFKTGDRESTAVLAIKANEKGKLSADWKSQSGEQQVTKVQFKGNKLSFVRKDQQGESTFEGTIKGQALTGVMKSGQSETSVEGKRIGAAVIGRWELEITSDSGSRRQLLKINPDLSAMYGPIPVEKINLDNDKVAFKTSVAFGDQNYEISFAGQTQGNKLTGEITTSRGTQKVTGKKRAQTPGKQQAVQVQETTHEPDVIYVPTPQEVVDKMLELAQVTKDDLVYDLGCGDGRIVVTAAKKYGCKAVGFDVAKKRIQESLDNVKKNNVGDLVQIEQKDIFTLDLSKANVVTLYLLPELNVKLIPQLEKLKPGSRIVSHDFDMEGVKPDKVVEVKTSDQNWNEHTIYLWTTPLKKE
jgi:precorrin-6B methylase 2